MTPYEQNEITVANQISKFIGVNILTGRTMDGSELAHPYCPKPEEDADTGMERAREDKLEELREQEQVKRNMENGN